VRWGEPFEMPYDKAKTQTKHTLKRHFPLGLNPDKTNEDVGDFWTVWRYDPSVWNRETTRRRAHVKVEEVGDGRVRVGVAVAQQISDNIEHPDDIDTARWVRKQRMPELEEEIELAISQRLRKVEPSPYFEEKYKKDGDKRLREDLIDRSRDVDLGTPDR
jgi:hypothetical protein